MRITARSQRRHTALGVAVLIVLGLAAWISTVAINGAPWSSPYRVRLALPGGAPLLTSGDDVRVNGERVGQVSSVALAAGNSSSAVATLSLSGVRVGAGASARIRPRGLAGAVYVDLDPGRAASRPLPSGSLLHVVSGSVQLTDVVAGFDASSRRALGTVLGRYGDGLAGRGVAVNAALGGAPALLRDLTVVLRTLSPAPGVLSALVGSATTVAGAVAPPGDTTLAGLIGSARSVLSATVGVGPAIAAIPPLERTAAGVLPGADALLSKATVAAQALAPGVSALAAALPALQTLERQAPAVSLLGAVARVATPVFSALAPVLADARGPAAALTPASDPVAELASVLIPYRTELIQAPLGFTRWGNFAYDFGTGAGHRAVRFSMILTCAYARDPYPAPGAAAKERKPCGQ